MDGNSWGRISPALERVELYADLVASAGVTLRMAEENVADAVRYRDESIARDRERGAALWHDTEHMTWVEFWQRRVERITAELTETERHLAAQKARLLEVVRDYGRAMVAAECLAVSA